VLLVACSRRVLGAMVCFYLNTMPLKIEEYSMSYELHETAGKRERLASGVPFCNVSIPGKTSIDENVVTP
jgi:hypothetical protein